MPFVRVDASDVCVQISRASAHSVRGRSPNRCDRERGLSKVRKRRRFSGFRGHRRRPPWRRARWGPRRTARRRRRTAASRRPTACARTRRVGEPRRVSRTPGLDGFEAAPKMRPGRSDDTLHQPSLAEGPRASSNVVRPTSKSSLTSVSAQVASSATRTSRYLRGLASRPSRARLEISRKDGRGCALPSTPGRPGERAAPRVGRFAVGLVACVKK